MTNNKESFFNDETINIYDIWLTLKKRLLLIFVIFFFFNLGTVSYVSFAPRVYRCSNILIYPLPHPDETNLIISSLIRPDAVYSCIKQFLMMKKAEQTKVIGLTPVEAKKVDSISISKEEAEKCTTFKIMVDAYDNETGKKTIDLTKKYINSIAFIKKTTQQMKSVYAESMPEIKLAIDNPSQYRNNDKGLMFSDSIFSLYIKISAITKLLNSNELIVLADDTYLPEYPYKPGIVKIILLGVVGGCFSGIGCAILLEWIARSKREYESAVHSSNDDSGQNQV